MDKVQLSNVSTLSLALSEAQTKIEFLESGDLAEMEIKCALPGRVAAPTITLSSWEKDELSAIVEIIKIALRKRRDNNFALLQTAVTT